MIGMSPLGSTMAKLRLSSRAAVVVAGLALLGTASFNVAPAQAQTTIYVTIPTTLAPAPPPPSLGAPAVAGPPVSVLGLQVTTSGPRTTTPTEVLGRTISSQVSPALTGSNVGGPIRLGLTLALGGAGLMLATRRRRRPTA
jgi:hypothetical protein